MPRGYGALRSQAEVGEVLAIVGGDAPQSAPPIARLVFRGAGGAETKPARAAGAVPRHRQSSTITGNGTVDALEVIRQRQERRLCSVWRAALTR